MNKTLLFSFILLFGVAFAVTYITDCTQITQSNEVYIFQNDISASVFYCIDIYSVENVTIDGNGHSMTNGLFYFREATKNITIKNITQIGSYRFAYITSTADKLYIENVLTANHSASVIGDTSNGEIYNLFITNMTAIDNPAPSYFFDNPKLIENITIINSTLYISDWFRNTINTYGEIYYKNLIVYNNYFINYSASDLRSGLGNKFNTSKTLSTNIVGGPYIGGNYWAKSDGTGFSQTCTDADLDGICDSSYEFQTGFYDYLPLADPPISITLTNPENNSSLSYLDYFNWTYSSSNAYECNITIDGTEYYAGENSTSYQAPNQANAVGKHTWNVTCWDSSTTTESETREYYILEKTITLTNPENNSYYQTQPNYFNWTTSNFIEPYNCNITINGVEYEAGENSTSYQNTLSNDEGTYTWYVKCWDSYDENTSETYQYTIDTTAPQITSLFLTYTNDTVDKFTVYCEVNESNIKEVWINLTSNDSYNHSGSVNATGNFDGTYYYADFLWTQEEGVLYNYSCYVEDLVGLSAYDEGNYSTMNASPSSTDYWANYTFSNVYISITSPKEQDTIPFKQYYLTFTIDQDFATPREAICKFYISYDLDYTDKTEIFSKTYTLDNSHTEIREPINTELSFLDYVGNYQRDTPSQQKVFIVCGLDNGYAGYTSTEYYVHLPSTLSLILIIVTFTLLIYTVYSIFYSDYGVLTSLLTLLVLLATVISFSADGISGSWYLKEIVVFLYHIINILFLIGMLEIVFENKQQMEKGL